MLVEILLSYLVYPHVTHCLIKANAVYITVQVSFP
jgi:hypothetical protein